jgi:DNA-binding LytR/AlgR family response regulator
MITHWETPAAHNIITELFEDGDSLLSAHAAFPFDIILLDIMMPLLNGIETARELREKDTTVKIVFLTSTTEYAVDSYTVKASNYLLKPVNPDSLFACPDELISQLQGVAKSIVVKGIDATHRILLSDIEHVEAQLKHVVFFLKGSHTVESLEPFYTYENMLVLDDGFFKCHRSYIVNIHHIDNYSHSSITMQSGRQIPLSRSCQKHFEASYFRVIFGKVCDEL